MVRAGMMRPNAATISPLASAAITNGSGVMSSQAAPTVDPNPMMTPPRMTAPTNQPLFTRSGRER
jgi:hypothetical protein